MESIHLEVRWNEGRGDLRVCHGKSRPNPIDSYSTYDNNEHGRDEERTIEVFDDLHIIGKEWTMVRRLLKVSALRSIY